MRKIKKFGATRLKQPIVGASVLLACGVALSGVAQANIIKVNDLSTFVSNTGASAEPAIPNNGKVISNGSGTATNGNLDFSIPSNRTNELFFGTDGVGGTNLTNWSNNIDGNDVALSGPEDITIASNSGPLTALGFEIDEPDSNNGLQNDSCNSSGSNGDCVNTTFNVKFFNNGAPKGDEDFTPDEGESQFYGFSLSNGDPFTKIVLTDETGNNDNEYFGKFYTARVPAPGTLSLLAIGLLGLGFSVQRRRLL